MSFNKTKFVEVFINGVMGGPRLVKSIGQMESKIIYEGSNYLFAYYVMRDDIAQIKDLQTALSFCPQNAV